VILTVPVALPLWPSEAVKVKVSTTVSLGAIAWRTAEVVGRKSKDSVLLTRCRELVTNRKKVLIRCTATSRASV
jgi:hypothetical protein